MDTHPIFPFLSFTVSPHPRGVDRNHVTLVNLHLQIMSPLTRGEWIEISCVMIRPDYGSVSPHPRGVDRNGVAISHVLEALVSPRPRGMDRNCASPET